MRLLTFTRYDNSGPSSRLRFFQYMPYLKDRGINIQVTPLFGPAYLHGLYSTGKRKLASVFEGYIRRLRTLLEMNSYDLIWIEKELFPWIPLLENGIVSILKKPYVVDYDDAVFHSYDAHEYRFIRSILGNKIDSIMRNAKIVTVGNDYLADHAKKVGARNIKVLPTVVDTLRYMNGPCHEQKFTIGWIGTPITEKYIEMIKKALEVLLHKGDVRIVLIGASQNALLGLKREILPWSENTEVNLIQSFDVGVMPLLDNPFERGKCGYKLIQYMACGVPVIASPVGVNQAIVEHGVNGFLARNENEWIDYMELLKTDKTFRTELGKNARYKVEKYFSLSQTAPTFYNLLVDAVK